MSELSLVIGNKSYSSWSLRPWLLLKHLGLAFAEIPVALQAADVVTQIARYSPSGRVPVLLAGDEVIWESLAIIEYLAEHYPGVWPTEAHQRILARSAANEMHAGFAALREALPFNCRNRRAGVEPSPAVQAEIDRVVNLWTRCRQTARDGAGPWLFGRFSGADAMFAPVALRFHTYGILLPEAAKTYVATVYQDVHVQAWIQGARTETGILPAGERGTPIEE